MMLIRSFVALGLALSVTIAVSAEELKVGAVAPEFEVKTFDGETIKLENLRGRKLVLAFNRAHWCPYCMKQIKDIQTNYDKIKNAGAEVLVVFREEEDGESGLQEVRKITGAKFLLGLDLNAVETSEYSQKGFTTYVIDAKGKIERVLPGTKPTRPLSDKILNALK
ncbi:MAG: peroxiredoxin family protein [Blastopirellula sp. JB062]